MPKMCLFVCAFCLDSSLLHIWARGGKISRLFFSLQHKAWNLNRKVTQWVIIIYFVKISFGLFLPLIGSTAKDWKRGGWDWIRTRASAWWHFMYTCVYVVTQQSYNDCQDLYFSPFSFLFLFMSISANVIPPQLFLLPVRGPLPPLLVRLIQTAFFSISRLRHCWHN